MRTESEIVERIQSPGKNDVFGFEQNFLLVYLGYEAALPFLNEGVTKQTWDDIRLPYSHDSIEREMEEYLNFAFDKAYGERGISSMRSMIHYDVWTWLLGDNNEWLYEYEDYGIENLERIMTSYKLTDPR